MQGYAFEEFELRSASDAQLLAIWQLKEQIRIERQPEDPPFPYEVLVARIRNIPAWQHIRQVLVTPAGGGPLCAAADIGMDNSGENAHLAQMTIDILPEHRDSGLDRHLLGWVAGVARQHNRRLLLGFAYDRVPYTQAFFTAVGAKVAIENRVSQLVLAELDQELLSSWQARASERASGFDLVSWDSTYPEDQLEAFADLYEVMNTAPHGDLDVEEQRMTPAKLRELIQRNAASQTRFFTVCARERETGVLAGFTEIFTNRLRPTIVNQGATAVRPDYREHGLGRWLKAAMLDLVQRELPEARYVRTDNAVSNAPMLAINVALGFKPYMATSIWQMSTDEALVAAGLEQQVGS